jgi:hypothetical protein
MLGLTSRQWPILIHVCRITYGWDKTERVTDLYSIAAAVNQKPDKVKDTLAVMAEGRLLDLDGVPYRRNTFTIGINKHYPEWRGDFELPRPVLLRYAAEDGYMLGDTILSRPVEQTPQNGEFESPQNGEFAADRPQSVTASASAESPQNGEFTPQTGEFQSPQNGEFESPQNGEFLKTEVTSRIAGSPQNGEFESPQNGEFESPQNGEFGDGKPADSAGSSSPKERYLVSSNHHGDGDRLSGAGDLAHAGDPAHEGGPAIGPNGAWAKEGYSLSGQPEPPTPLPPAPLVGWKRLCEVFAKLHERGPYPIDPHQAELRATCVEYEVTGDEFADVLEAWAAKRRERRADTRIGSPELAKRILRDVLNERAAKAQREANGTERVPGNRLTAEDFKARALEKKRRAKEGLA